MLADKNDLPSYMSYIEYKKVREWWIDNYDKMMKELKNYIWLFPFWVYDEDKINSTFLKRYEKDIDAIKGIKKIPIWNVSEKEYNWLIKNWKHGNRDSRKSRSR